ncbi:hypothetical protein MNBD_PLANCTO03-85 [hydrothermal vent metagenome]|uniref:Uncharacterized protein n=1 Tax=hydrothermal vent metagenome TaxID=652676 RepID=A0A3B1E987_9ZZZZ
MLLESLLSCYGKVPRLACWRFVIRGLEDDGLEDEPS